MTRSVPVRTKSFPCAQSGLVRTAQNSESSRAHERVWCAQNGPRAHGDEAGAGDEAGDGDGDCDWDGDWHEAGAGDEVGAGTYDRAGSAVVATPRQSWAVSPGEYMCDNRAGRGDAPAIWERQPGGAAARPYREAKSSRARPARSTARSTALSLIWFSLKSSAPKMKVITTLLRLIIEMTESSAPSSFTA